MAMYHHHQGAIQRTPMSANPQGVRIQPVPQPTLIQVDLREALQTVHHMMDLWEICHVENIHVRLAGYWTRKVFVAQIDAAVFETNSAEPALAWLLECQPDLVLGRVWMIPHFQHFHRPYHPPDKPPVQRVRW